MHTKKIITAGTDLREAKKALIMLHGRGASAADILTLAPYLHVKDYAILAPEATNSTWYPYSFQAPPAQNEPWLSSALGILSDVTAGINGEGIADENIFFTGFSQGACLTLEFVTRHARKWGGVVAFTGGLIGDTIRRENYRGDFEQTPVFIGCSDPDPHVPLHRVRESAGLLRAMNASLTEKIYPQMGHTISQDELDTANKLIFGG